MPAPPAESSSAAKPRRLNAFPNANCLMPSAFSLPQITQQSEQVRHADGAIAIEVGWAIIAVATRPPVGEQDEKITHTNRTLAIEARARLRGETPRL